MFTIEHILPQNVSLLSEWNKLWPDIELREFWLNKLANLVPLTRSNNSKAQNYNFADKKRIYFNISKGVTSFALTTQILNIDSWTPAIVEKRQKELIDILVNYYELSLTELNKVKSVVIHASNNETNVNNKASINHIEIYSDLIKEFSIYPRNLSTKRGLQYFVYVKDDNLYVEEGHNCSEEMKAKIRIPRLLPENKIMTYGIDNYCEVLAKDITITNSYVDFRVKVSDRNERVKVDIPGRFSVYNALAAICVAKKLGIASDKVIEALAEIKVPGRSEMVPNKKEIPIMIDYAHSPESLQNILSAVKSYTRGRVISVFGCGGDRDKGKRPLMGEISGKIADFTFITTDNPRTEEPEEIVKEIEEGMKKTNGKYKVVVDRKEAIKEAIEMANKLDIIVLAGKGHEPYQEINGTKYPFDERIIVKEIIG